MTDRTADRCTADGVGGDSATRTVVGCDVVRQAFLDRFAVLGYQRSVIVAFSADRGWAQ